MSDAVQGSPNPNPMRQFAIERGYGESIGLLRLSFFFAAPDGGPLWVVLTGPTARKLGERLIAAADAIAKDAA